MLIVNAKIFPMNAPAIENGYLLTNGPFIQSIGPMQQVPQTDSDRIDACLLYTSRCV